jgi:hypothetical protein
VETIQQPAITGYRPLGEGEAALMNEVKEVGQRVGELVAKLRTATVTRVGVAAEVVACDQRWVSIGATDLQQGFMALTRAIAQPTTF